MEEATESVKTFQLSVPKVKKRLKTVAKRQSDARCVFLQSKTSESSFVYNPDVSYRNGYTLDLQKEGRKELKGHIRSMLGPIHNYQKVESIYYRIC